MALGGAKAAASEIVTKEGSESSKITRHHGQASFWHAFMLLLKLIASLTKQEHPPKSLA